MQFSGDQPAEIVRDRHVRFVREHKMTGARLSRSSTRCGAVIEMEAAPQDALKHGRGENRLRRKLRQADEERAGHFLAAVEIDSTPMLIDPFAGGRMLTPA